MIRLLLIVLLPVMLIAQDVQFSQIHSFPLHLNPAMTGFFDGDIRAGAIYRNQWFTVNSDYGNAKYQTVGAYIDGSLLKGILKNDYLGVGACFFNDWAGDMSYRTTDVTMNLAYSKGFGRTVKHSIALGLQGNLRMVGLNASKAVFSDGITENIIGNSTTFDAGVGVRYHVAIRRRLNMYIGGAYTHILQPSERLVSVGTKLPGKITVHAGAVADINDKFNLIPSVMFLYQGAQWMINAGTYAQYVFSMDGDEKNGIALGAWTRVASPAPDAVIAGVRLDYKGLQVAFSYDFNISELGKATSFQGGPELGVTYIAKIKRVKKDRAPCARF
jgi:type IX secretion system PorP/SprF family membrane protein